MTPKFKNKHMPKPSVPRATIQRYSDRLLQTLEEPSKAASPVSIQGLMNADTSPMSRKTSSISSVSMSPKLHNLINVAEDKDDVALNKTIESEISQIKMPEIFEAPTADQSRPLIDHSVVNPMSDTDSSTAFSPDSLMAPFLHYANLHRTFRDYMFTNVVTSTDMTAPNDLNDVTFKNILYSPAPEFLNHKNSSKNLQDLLNEADFSIATDFRQAQMQLTTPKFVLGEAEKLQLLKAYLYEVAPWLDMFDSSKQFGTKVIELALSSDALMSSIYAIASRQKEQVDDKYPPQKTIQLYQETLVHLIPTVNKTLDNSIITTCVILCVFEMMSASPRKWRYHLEGCAALFKAHNIHGFCNDLERGLFWCYARMDVSSAVIGEESTIIPSENWLPYDCSVYDSKAVFTKFGNEEDMYANYMVFLCSRVLNLIAKTKDEYYREWLFLWDEVSDWFLNRPYQLKPISSHTDSPFPGVLYLNGPAISANQMYHMAVILLTQNKPRLHKIKYSDHNKSPIWHAKQICAISLHNEHHGCWNNALQPLWIAGQLLSSEQEHKIVLDLLAKIESTTGWQMNFRAKDLKRHWEGELLN